MKMTTSGEERDPISEDTRQFILDELSGKGYKKRKFLNELNRESKSKIPPKLLTDEARRITVDAYVREINDTFLPSLVIPEDINCMIHVFITQGIYLLTYISRPFGFSGIGDDHEKDVIVSSVQNDINFERGLIMASRMYGINDYTVIGKQHEDILNLVLSLPLPIDIYFLKVRCYISCNAILIVLCFI